MRAGDVVVEVAQDERQDTDQILRKIDEAKKAGRKSVLLLVDRQGDLRFVAVKIETANQSIVRRKGRPVGAENATKSGIQTNSSPR